MAYEYDKQNIFAKILRGEIPNSTVLSTDFSLAFRDISPQAPEHILVIPRGPYVCFDHFITEASDSEILDFNRTIAKICEKLGLQPGFDGEGYRLIANSGSSGVQDVPHFHMHILSGRNLGRMLQKFN
jgi:histidine triad (HIT) family protein